MINPFVRHFLLGASSLLLLGPAANAQEIYTGSSGYVKHTLDPGFNLIGIALHESSVATGTIESESGAEITDSDGDFVTLLDDATATYILEITSGAQSGAVAGIASWTSTTVTLDGALGAGTADYTIRPAKTLDGIFGTSLTGAGFDPSSADKVWIATTGGAYDQYFYSTVGSEFRHVDEAFTPRTKPVAVFYPDAMFVEIKATTKIVTLFGDVKSIPTVVSANQGFNLVRVSSPVGQTLAESNLELYIQQVPAFDGSLGDKVWIQDGSGGWNQYAYSTTYSQWKPADNMFGTDQGGVMLPSGVLIERLATQPDTTAVFDLPAFFSDL